MKKILIYLILSFLVFCSFLTPTFSLNYVPSDLYSYSLVNEFENNNFYNQNNIDDIYLNNFQIDIPIGSDMYFFKGSLQSPLYDGFSYTTHSNILGIPYDLNWTLTSRYDGYYGVKINSFNLDSSQDYKVYLSEPYLHSVDIVFNLYPLFNYVTNLSSVHYYTNFKIKYDINYGNQYYYNNTIGFYFRLNQSNISTFNNFGVDSNFIDNNNFIFSTYFNSSIITDNNVVYPNHSDWLLINNRFNFENSYIKTIQHDFYFGHLYSGNSVPTFSLVLNEMHYDATANYSNFIYSGNSLGSDSLSSPLIPITSDSFYKNGEWWDIPTHLYNFFIYLVFDAPIVSNFTKLVIILVNFVVELFGFLIILFTGVDNLIFSSIFIGFIVLIFLLKIIFKG